MQNKLWIFGDSFADPDYNTTGAEHYQWCKRLEQHYEVTNMAVYGSGPQWSLNNFLKMLDNADKNTNVLFIESTVYRLDLGCWEKPKNQIAIHKIAKGQNRHPQSEFLKGVVKYVLTEDFENAEPLKILCTVQNLSRYVNKILYLPVIEAPFRKYGINKKVKNFYMPDFRLMEKSDAEPECKRPWPNGDIRCNHFSEYNHDFMYKLITDYFND